MLAFGSEVARLTLWLALLTAFFVPLERLFAIQPQKILRKQFGTDLAYYLLNSVAAGAMLALPLALVVAAAHRFVPGSVIAITDAIPFWPKLALALLVSEIGFYWGHRLSHEVPLLWRFHAIHHSAEEVDFLVNTRVHPIDMVFTRLAGLAPLYLLGLEGGVVAPAVVIVAAAVWGFFVHSNIRWRLGWFEWVIATPVFHRWHHTNDAYRDHNYAPMLPFIDHIFGTLHLPREWPSCYGVDQPVPSDIAGQLLHPFTKQPDLDAGSPGCGDASCRSTAMD